MSECIFCRILDGQLAASCASVIQRRRRFARVGFAVKGGVNFFLADGEAAMQEVFTFTCTSFRAFAATGSE
jgi:hypothetical protein